METTADLSLIRDAEVPALRKRIRELESEIHRKDLTIAACIEEIARLQLENAEMNGRMKAMILGVGGL